MRPWLEPRGLSLPGVSPVAPEEWLLRDEAYAAQMAYRDHLLETHTEQVLDFLPGTQACGDELLRLLLETLPRTHGHHITPDVARRPDGVQVKLHEGPTLGICGRLVQEDLLLLRQTGEDHILVGGVLCFPSLWRLSEKLGKPMLAIHRPVDAYTQQLNRRVERILASVRPGQVLMRANTLIHEDPDLHQPAPEGAQKHLTPDGPRYIRVERQTFRRLPETGAILFAIHTYLIPASRLSEEDRDTLAQLRPDLSS
ncbi:MAG: DUF3445 domain-containing protein [Hyphomonadaceae bacterium]|nr:DUF3445 domain-containing protein [Hyphomonadaceae bacterium]